MKKITKQDIPNAITLSRIVATILGVVLSFAGFHIAAFSSFTFAAITDYLDGYFARKLNAYSNLGRVLDPVSDKLFVVALLISGLALGNIYFLASIFYEALIIVIGTYAKIRKVENVTSIDGKIKTVFLFANSVLGYLMTALIPGLIYLFVPIWITTVLLQAKTAAGYIKQYKENKIKKETGTLEDVNTRNMEVIEEEKELLEKINIQKKN